MNLENPLIATRVIDLAADVVPLSVLVAMVCIPFFAYRKLMRAKQVETYRQKEKLIEQRQIVDLLNDPIESKRRDALVARGLNIDEMVEKFIERIQIEPPPDQAMTAMFAASLGWFAVPPLRDLLHDELAANCLLVVACLASIEDMVLPPVMFERPRKDVVERAALLFNNHGVDDMEKRREFKAAIANFDKSLFLAPNEPRTLFNKASALGATGDYKAAIECLVAAGTLRPHDAKIIAGLGKYYGYDGQFAEARKCFDALASLGAQNAQYWADRSAMLERERMEEN